MANTTFKSLQDQNDSLVIVPRNLLVLVAPYGTSIPATLTDQTGLLQPGSGWESLGMVSRDNVSIGGDGDKESIQGYGSLIPRRVIKTEESMSFSFKTQEYRKKALELFFGQDLSGVTADANGEWRAYKGSGDGIVYNSVIVLGMDGSTAKPIFPFWIFPKMSASSSSEVTLAMASELGLPITLDAFEDQDFGTDGAYVAYGMAGAGAKDLSADMGFSSVTSITVSPASTSLSLSGTTTQQLTVTDQNSNDVTSQCSFSSSKPSVATVDSSGLITAAGTGSATVTATFGALSKTCAVTVNS